MLFGFVALHRIADDTTFLDTLKQLIRSA